MASVFLALSCLPRRLAQLLQLGLSFHASAVLSLALSGRADVSQELDHSPEGWTLEWTWTSGHPAALLSTDTSRAPAPPPLLVELMRTLLGGHRERDLLGSPETQTLG